MTRFLQGAFAEARFVMVVRHPAIVSLSTRKWARLRSLGALLDHWFAAHRTFEEDAAFLHYLLVVKYERLVTDPEATLAEIAAFLEDGEIPAASIDTRRSATYERQWSELASGGPWRRERFRSLCRRYEGPPTTSATASSTWTAPTRSRSAPPAPLSRSGQDRTIWPQQKDQRGTVAAEQAEEPLVPVLVVVGPAERCGLVQAVPCVSGAPRWTSSSATSRWPMEAARCSGVSP